MSKKETLPVTQPKAGLPVQSDLDAALLAESGEGFEGTSTSDYAIPFLSILQAMSPQCTQGNPEFNEDLRPGMFYNTVTREAFKGKDGVFFVPAKYRRVGLLWVPQRDGGGFKGSIDQAALEALLANCQRDDDNHEVTPDGLHLQDTREWYGLQIDAQGTTMVPVLLSLSSTQLKKSKRWLTLAQGLKYNGKTPPLFSQVYHLTTVPESNDKGSWMGLDVKHVGTVPNMEVFEAAKQFREMVDSGTAKAAQPDAGVEAEDLPY